MEVAPTTVSLSETARTVTVGESFEFTATISDESLPTAVSTNAGAVQVTYLRQEGNTHIYQIRTLQAGDAEIRISANGEMCIRDRPLTQCKIRGKVWVLLPSGMW